MSQEKKCREHDIAKQSKVFGHNENSSKRQVLSAKCLH